MLTAIDIIVVLYFFLLLFKFLYANSPPVLNNFDIIFGTFNFFEFSFISLEPLNPSIGLTLLAFIADVIDDKYIVTNPNTADKIIGTIDILNTNPSTCCNK